MNYWKVILATMVIFGTGVVTGGLLVQRGARFRPAHGTHSAPAPSRSASMSAPVVTPGALRLEFLRGMQKELDLTPEQHERIDRIFSQSQEHTRKIMEPLKPQINEELKHTRQLFREALTLRQREHFDELVRQQQQHQREQRRASPARERPAGESTPITNAPAGTNRP